jgi:signal transduction histidine kinase
MHDDLQEEIDGMDALVGDLLATARIDFSALNPVPLDPADVAARAMEIARVDASRLTLSGHGIVRADPTLLGRALSGLLSNAQRHGGGTARLTVERQATQVRFLVDDDGPGFGPGEEESAFQPFWRRPGESTKGVGLGLALVRRIARSHGGDAGAQNREEGGARVWLSLPVAEP